MWFCQLKIVAASIKVAMRPRYLYTSNKNRGSTRRTRSEKSTFESNAKQKTQSQKFAKVQPRRKFHLIRRLGLYRLARAPKARRRREYHNTKLRIRKTQTHDRGPEIEMLSTQVAAQIFWRNLLSWQPWRSHRRGHRGKSWMS